jgi:hypothetical protein
MTRVTLQYTLLSAPLLVLLACVETQAEGRGNDAGSGGSSASPVIGSDLPSMLACGHPISLAPVEPSFGFSLAAGSPEPGFHSSSLSGGAVLISTGQEAVVRSSTDFGVLGRVAVPGGDVRSAVVGGWALVEGYQSGLALLDVSSPANPRVHSWWLDASQGQAWLSLVGASQGLFALRTHSGLSFVEIGEAGPREVFCFEQPESVSWGNIDLNGNVLAIKERLLGTSTTDVPRLYHVTESGVSAWTSLPFEGVFRFISTGGHMAIESNLSRQLTLYDVTGAEPREIATVDGLPMGFRERAIGGFNLRSEQLAVDLRGNLELYDVTPIAGSECLLRVVPRAGGESFIISPLIPEQRLPAAPVPSVSCPGPERANVGTITVSPDGNTLLQSSGDRRWIFRDMRTGEERSMPRIPDAEGVSWLPTAYWVGDRLVIREKYISASDTLTTDSWLRIAAVEAPNATLARVNSPWPIITMGTNGEELWALTYSETNPAIENKGHRLWRLDPKAEVPSPVILTTEVDDVSTFEVLGDRLYLVGADSLRITDRDGNTLQQVPLPAAAESTAVSALGFFMANDEVGGVWHLAPQASSFVPLVEDCVACTVLGANASRVYLSAVAPPDPLAPLLEAHREEVTYRELRAYDMQSSDPQLVGRYPISFGFTNRLVSAGGTLAFIGTDALIEEEAGQ